MCQLKDRAHNLQKDYVPILTRQSNGRYPHVHNLWMCIIFCPGGTLELRVVGGPGCGGTPLERLRSIRAGGWENHVQLSGKQMKR